MANSPPSYLSPAQREFMKLLAKASRYEGHRDGDILRTWLAMSYHAIRKGTLPVSKQDDAEREYMAHISKMRDVKNTAPIMGDLLGLLSVELTGRCFDFLGPIFMETISDPGKGQFFTPDELAYAMALMTLDATTVTPGEWLTMAEPAAGTGTIVFATCRAAKEKGIHYQKQIRWTLTELDYSAYMGLYVQASLLGLDAIVHCANTLTLQVYDHAITPVHYLQRFSKPVSMSPKINPRIRHRVKPE